MLDRAWSHWKALLVVTVVAGVAIVTVGPHHDQLQTAADADDFRRELDSTGRHLAAGLIDVVFAAAYGLLGVAALCALGGRGLGTRAGMVAIAAGALCDELENVFLVANIARHDDLTDGWIDAMQVPGTLKWLAAPGFLLLFAILIVRAVRRRTAL